MLFMLNASEFNSWSIFLILVFGTTSSILGAIKYLDGSQLMMPNEYKVIKKIVTKLAKTNDLGTHPLSFTIISGSRAYWTAEALQLVKQEGGWFYSNINPFKTYMGKSSQEINEAIRQSYLLNGIEAYAYPNGTISISHSTFRSHKNKDDYLACIIGHEISHVLNHDSFHKSLRQGKEGKKLKKKKKELLGYRISRETESKADINAAKMMIKAGYPRDTCLKALDFTYKYSGDGRATEKDSTHPGYEDRRAELDQFLEAFKNIDSSKERTKGKWVYDRSLNNLTFIPK